MEVEKEKEKIFKPILDGLKMDIYITDLDTDEIIFMNKEMKVDYGLEHPEGHPCWKVLQDNRDSRCEFCPVERLRRQEDKDYVYQWDEVNAVTQRSYRNYDSLIEWEDGRMVHLQQSIDVTELKSANTDELTHFYTRRYGKELLKSALEDATGNQSITVCLYDINSLKEVNDTYGHMEGDSLIAAVADAVKRNLKESEFAFRLSGDEFVIVYQGGQKCMQTRIQKVREEIEGKKHEYEMSFCFGLAEFTTKNPMSADELLFLADQRMYEEKRAFHIRRNATSLKKERGTHREEVFQYDKEKLYDALVRSTDAYIYVCNMKTGIFKYTKAMVEEFNLPCEVIENAAAVWGEKVHPDDKVAFLEANQDIEDGRTSGHCVEYRAINRNGEWVWVRCRGHLERDESGEPILFAGFITNLGKKNKIDGLTGLFNKLEFQEQIEHLLNVEQQFSVMLLGIDNLKHINDLYSRSFGDKVIRIVAQRLQSLLSGDTLICRLDGDVFGVIVRNAHKDNMEAIYRTIYHSFEFQQELEAKKYYCTLSGGCVFCPTDAFSYDSLIKYANYCLDYSKNHGKKQCTFFSHDILDQRAHSLAMLEVLRECVENHFEGFRLAFQPIVRSQTGSVMGAEALARWECKQFGAVSPLEFIPLLESSGLIIEVGEWILRTALRAAKSWIAQAPDFLIGVNLSYIQVQDADFLSALWRVIKEENFPPHNLVLELTESYFVKENEQVKRIFQEVRNTGIRIALDDFGTGYSTLEILKECPADIVKIDKTFIRDINKSEFDATFIRFVVELCHNAGIEVCLEGVETQETYGIVNPMGLDFIQGYLFDKPLEEAVFQEKYFEAGKEDKQQS